MFQNGINTKTDQGIIICKHKKELEDNTCLDYKESINLFDFNENNLKFSDFDFLIYFVAL